MKVGSVITLFMRISLRWSPFDWSSGHLRIYEENRVCVKKEGYCLCNPDDTDDGLEQSALMSLPTWGSWIKGFFHFHRVHLYASPPKGPAFNAEGLKIRTEELKAAPSHFWRNWLLIWAVRHIALPYCYSSRLCLTHSLCGCLCYSPFSYICEGTAFNQNTAVFRGQGAKGEGARTNARSLPFPVCSFTGEQLLRLPSPQPGRETAAACQLTGCRNSLWCWAVCVNHQLLFPERPFARRSCQAAEHGREQTCFTARNSCHNCLCELWGGLGHALEVT